MVCRCDKLKRGQRGRVKIFLGHGSRGGGKGGGAGLDWGDENMFVGMLIDKLPYICPGACQTCVVGRLNYTTLVLTLKT